mgnify:CR=1 FL=1
MPTFPPNLPISRNVSTVMLTDVADRTTPINMAFRSLITLQGDVGQFLEDTAEIGVIFLMFSAGLDTDVRELKKNSISAFVVAGIRILNRF